MTWIRIHFFHCGSRIRLRINIKWILSTAENRQKLYISNDWNRLNLLSPKEYQLFSDHSLVKKFNSCEERISLTYPVHLKLQSLIDAVHYIAKLFKSFYLKGH